MFLCRDELEWWNEFSWGIFRLLGQNFCTSLFPHTRYLHGGPVDFFVQPCLSSLLVSKSSSSTELVVIATLRWHTHIHSHMKNNWPHSNDCVLIVMWQWDNWHKQERRKLLSGDQKTSALKCKHIIINCSNTVTFYVHTCSHQYLPECLTERQTLHRPSGPPDVDVQKWTRVPVFSHNVITGGPDLLSMCFFFIFTLVLNTWDDAC